MSDICLEYFGNGIKAIDASAQNLSLLRGLLSNRSNDLLRALVEYRRASLPVLYEIRSILENQPCFDRVAVDAPSEITPSELCKLIRTIMDSIENTDKTLARASRVNLFTLLYYRFAVSSMASKIVDGLYDILAVAESLAGEDGDLVSGNEVLRKLG